MRVALIEARILLDISIVEVPVVDVPIVEVPVGIQIPIVKVAIVEVPVCIQIPVVKVPIGIGGPVGDGVLLLGIAHRVRRCAKKVTRVKAVAVAGVAVAVKVGAPIVMIVLKVPIVVRMRCIVEACVVR